MAGTATAVEPPSLPPISEGLASLLANPLDEPSLIMVHGKDMTSADRAVADSGMTKVTEFTKVGIVVARANSSRIEQARTEPGVTYLEAPERVEFNTDTSQEATRGKRAREIFNGDNGKNLDGTGVTIAIVDSGIYPTHPSFAGGKVVNSLECVDGKPGCSELDKNANSDTLGHGTAVAGVAAGNIITSRRARPCPARLPARSWWRWRSTTARPTSPPTWR